MKASEIDWSKAPEGATHWEEKSCRWIRIAGGVIFGAQFCRSHSWERIAIPLNHELVERPAGPCEWNGTGLPPIGAVCEGRARATQEWSEVVVLAHRIGKAVVSFTDCERLQWCDVDELRPIRTPEQIAAEEREKAIEQMIEDYKYKEGPCTHHLMRSQAERIYDAGYRKVGGGKQ